MDKVVAYVRSEVPFVKLLSVSSEFERFTSALGPSARYDAQERAHRVPLKELPSVLARLRAFASVEEERTVRQALDDHSRLIAYQSESLEERLARCKKPLYPYQQDGARWLTQRSTGLLADDMGLGKTAQAILAIPQRSRTLVVCPSCAIGTWEREIPAWRSDLRCHPMTRATLEFPTWPYVGLISCDSLTDSIKIPPNSTVIVDEAHMLKSSKSQRNQLARSIILRVIQSKGRAWLLTGTPLLNRPQELWNLLNVAGLSHEAFGSWAQFVDLFGGVQNGPRGSWERTKGGTRFRAHKGGEHGQFGLKWGDPSPEAKILLRKVMLRREKRDVLPDLPGKTYSTLAAKIDKNTLKLCDKLMESLPKGESLDDFYNRLSKPAEFSNISSILEKLSAAKIPSMLQHIEQIEDQGEPLVVFSKHRRPVETLKERQGWITVMGDDSSETKAKAVDRFQHDPSVKGIAGTIGAMGTSVTLTRARAVLFVGREWTPAYNAQAEDRIARIGQKFPVMVYDLVADHPLDERISEVLIQKTRLISSVV